MLTLIILLQILLMTDPVVIDFLIKQTPIVAILLIIGYILYKKYDKGVEANELRYEKSLVANELRLKTAEEKIEKYMSDDHNKIMTMMTQFYEAFKQNTESNVGLRDTIKCLNDEISQVKKSDGYKNFNKTQL